MYVIKVLRHLSDKMGLSHMNDDDDDDDSIHVYLFLYLEKHLLSFCH